MAGVHLRQDALMITFKIIYNTQKNAVELTWFIQMQWKLEIHV